MPFTASGSWTPRATPKSNERESELRPHWITLALSLVYTIVTTIAVIVGVITLRENNRTFQIANQAYVTIEHVTFTFKNNDELVTTFDFENTGLTNALDVEFRIAHMGKNDVSIGTEVKPPLLNAVPLRFYPTLMGDRSFVLVPHQIMPASYFYTRSMVGVEPFFYRLVRYKTIFGKDRSIYSCYQADFDKQHISTYCPLEKLHQFAERTLNDEEFRHY